MVCNLLILEFMSFNRQGTADDVCAAECSYSRSAVLVLNSVSSLGVAHRQSAEDGDHEGNYRQEDKHALNPCVPLLLVIVLL